MPSTDESPEIGGISIHAVDIARGIPAAGLALRLRRVEPNPAPVAAGACSASGHFEHPVTGGAGVERGVYEVEFEVGTFFRNAGVAVPDPSFLDVAVFRFGIDRINEHFHLPFKFTPWGFSLFRGGA